MGHLTTLGEAMDLFDDIPDDLDSMHIDDLFFSEYLDNMSANLLEPSGSSAEAFSGSQSDNPQLDGMCEWLLCTLVLQDTYSYSVHFPGLVPVTSAIHLSPLLTYPCHHF